MKPALPSLEDQKRAVSRARTLGRRWMLRGTLLAVVAVVSFLRGGGFYSSLGAALAVVALLGVHLGRQMRLSAAEMERKIALMAGIQGDGGTGGRGDGDTA